MKRTLFGILLMGVMSAGSLMAEDGNWARHEDRREVRQDRERIARDRAELRHDRRDLRHDRREYRHDYRDRDWR